VVVVLLFALGARAALGAGRDSSPPIASVSIADPTGDAGSGPDLTGLTATVSSSGMLTLTATVVSGIKEDQSVQFFILTPENGQLNIAAYDDGTSQLGIWDGSEWEGIRDNVTSWSGNTLTSTVALGELQSAIHQSVEPALEIAAESSVHADAPETPVTTDAVPDSGWMGVATVAQAPPSTTTTTAPPPHIPAPTTTSSGGGQKEPAPYLEQRVAYMARGRVEWKQLTVERVPTGATVAIACTKGCTLKEQLKVVHGSASSKTFVGRPFSHGVTFVARVRERGGTGWWLSRSVIVAKPGGPEISNGHGCISASGTLGKC
jgi:hypothetical protein